MLTRCFGKASRLSNACAPRQVLVVSSVSLQGRLFCSSREFADIETAQGVFGQLMGGAEGGNGARVLATKSSTLHCSLFGAQTAVGKAVSLGRKGEGIVLSFDKQCAIVGPIRGDGVQSGDEVVLGGPLVIHMPNPLACGVVFASVSDLLRPRSDTHARAGPQVIRLPRFPPPNLRRPVQRRLPSGLAAVEVLMPLGEGHRVGLVGPPGTGKSKAVHMILKSQPPGTAIVYGTYGSRQQLEAKIGTETEAAQLTVVHADASDTATTRYLMPLCALHVATEFRKTHRHVLLVLDNLVAFADAEVEVGTPPLSAPHILASSLDGAGRVEVASGTSALSVVAVLDVAPEDEMRPPIKALFHGAEPSFDVVVNFDMNMVVKGIMPAIDPDHLAIGFDAVYQPPLMRILRAELVDNLRRSKALHHRLDSCNEFGIEPEADEEEELRSLGVSRALLAHCSARPLQELIVLTCAAQVYHFPVPRPPSSASIAALQEAVINCIRETHPMLWNSLGLAEDLDNADAVEVVARLREVLLAHRRDFQLTRPA